MRDNEGCVALVAVALVLLVLALFLSPLFLMLAWNLAVCALFPMLPSMTYWIAFGVDVFLWLVGSNFRNPIKINKN